MCDKGAFANLNLPPWLSLHPDPTPEAPDRDWEGGWDIQPPVCDAEPPTIAVCCFYFSFILWIFTNLFIKMWPKEFKLNFSKDKKWLFCSLHPLFSPQKNISEYLEQIALGMGVKKSKLWFSLARIFVDEIWIFFWFRNLHVYFLFCLHNAMRIWISACIYQPNDQCSEKYWTILAPHQHQMPIENRAFAAGQFSKIIAFETQIPQKTAN